MTFALDNPQGLTKELERLETFFWEIVSYFLQFADVIPVIQSRKFSAKRLPL